jgi:hypothetical protein
MASSSIVPLAHPFSRSLLLFSPTLSENLHSTKATGDLVAIKLIKRPLPKIILPNILREIRVRKKKKGMRRRRHRRKFGF